MATQEVSRELGVPLYGTVFIYCGLCAVNRPTEPLRRIGKAGGQRFQQVGFEFLRDFFDDPGALSSLDYIDPEPQLVDQPSDWWKRTKLQKIRTGVLYEVRRNAHRIDYQEFAADVASRQYRPDIPNLDEIVSEALGFERTTASPHHLSLVKLADDEQKSLLTCGKCGTTMRVGRERLAIAVDHVKKLGGEILVLPLGIEVRGSSKSFEWRPHRRSKRLVSRRPSDRSSS